MACRSVPIGLVDGVMVRGIVCGPKPPAKKCCGCGQRKARRQCDWKLRDSEVNSKRPGEVLTCSAWICDECTVEPAPDKDLCPTHAAAWEEHKARARVQP